MKNLEDLDVDNEDALSDRKKNGNTKHKSIHYHTYTHTFTHTETETDTLPQCTIGSSKEQANSDI